MDPLKMYFLFKIWIFHSYVSLPESVQSATLVFFSIARDLQKLCIIRKLSFCCQITRTNRSHRAEISKDALDSKSLKKSLTFSYEKRYIFLSHVIFAANPISTTALTTFRGFFFGPHSIGSVFCRLHHSLHWFFQIQRTSAVTTRNLNPLQEMSEP